MKKKVFEVQIGSPPDYEELVAYLYYGHAYDDPGWTEKEVEESSYSKDSLEKTVSITHEDGKIKEEVSYRDKGEIAILHQEKGPNKIKIKFSDYVLKNEMYVDDLLKAIKKAKKDLLE